MFLTVNKKAATEAEADVLLAQSFALENPFGIPTIVLEQQKFRQGIELRSAFKGAATDNPVFPRYWGRVPYGAEGHNLAVHYRDVFKKSGRFPAEQGEALYKKAYTSFFDTDDFERLWLQDGFGEFSMVHRVKQSDGKRDYADRYDPENYKDPRMNIVVTSLYFNSGRQYLADFLSVPLSAIKPMPGSKAQWGFFGLWHEFSHGAGAGEPQAEMMAALMSRKFFEDQSFLLMQADTRTVASVLMYEHAEGRKQYYAMDDAIYQVLMMDQSDIDAMSMDDIKAQRFREFKRNEGAIISAGVTLERTAKEAFNSCSLSLLGEVAKEIIRKGRYDESDPDGRVLRRFYQATQRLSQGIPAYSSKVLPTLVV